MNNRFISIMALIASSAIFISGCGDTSSFETPNTDLNTTLNSGIASQKNFSLLAENTQPLIYDATTGIPTDTSLNMTVKIGDSKNQLLTDAHTIFFATEWGLIESSCVTVNGTCSVTWETSFSPTSTPPTDRIVTITAYTLGEEEYSDTNGNGQFDNDDQPLAGSADLFFDRVEPFVNADRDMNTIFNSGDTIIDVIDGNVLGTNGEHDFNDGLLNSPNCTHNSLCSTISPTTYIWDDIEIDMDPPPAAP